MSRFFEELGFAQTPIGDISLRRRHEPRVGYDVYEIKLGDEFLMSSLVTTSEIALADLALAACPGDALDVAVGGLGLGYTAQAVLASGRVSSLIVIDALREVIDWHRDGLIPLDCQLADDPRCKLSYGDFFARAADTAGGLDPETPGRRFDIILVDIDHSPDALLDASSESFYSPTGFAALRQHLKPGGIFGLWSNEAPDIAIIARLETAFTSAWAEAVDVATPLRERPFVQTVYLART